jgi:uncharacterized protein YdhG (YjbR/CyaY superfamily)
MAGTPGSVDEYIASFPPPTQEALERCRRAIHEAAEDIVEKISYGIAGFTLENKNVLYLGGWKRHLALYPIPPVSDDLHARLAPYRTGRGTLKFPLDEEIPLALIAEVARAAARTAEN